MSDMREEDLAKESFLPKQAVWDDIFRICDLISQDQKPLPSKLGRVAEYEMTGQYLNAYMSYMEFGPEMIQKSILTFMVAPSSNLISKEDWLKSVGIQIQAKSLDRAVADGLDYNGRTIYFGIFLLRNGRNCHLNLCRCNFLWRSNIRCARSQSVRTGLHIGSTPNK